MVESEFATVLHMFAREGNTLSALIRQAWDRGDLRILTRSMPLKATGAHISIIGHITEEELKRYLTATEIANGFGNRFLWVCVKRSKLLPYGGGIGEEDFANIISRLTEAVSFSRTVTEMPFDEQAREMWARVYEELAEERSGLFEAIVSRAEAQIRRIACLYALLDCSPVVRKVHLEAAVAVWDYCEQSAAYLFGGCSGDPLEDRLLKALSGSSKGMSRTDIHALFKRHASKKRLDNVLETLKAKELVSSRKVPTDGG